MGDIPLQWFMVSFAYLTNLFTIIKPLNLSFNWRDSQIPPCVHTSCANFFHRIIDMNRIEWHTFLMFNDWSLYWWEIWLKNDCGFKEFTTRRPAHLSLWIMEFLPLGMELRMGKTTISSKTGLFTQSSLKL